MTTLKPEGAQTKKKKKNSGQNSQRDSLYRCPESCGSQSSTGSSATNPSLKLRGREERVVKSILVQEARAQRPPLLLLPPSLLHSSLLALPHASSISSGDPKFNYSQAAVGGSSLGPAERNSDTFPVQSARKKQHFLVFNEQLKRMKK